MTTLSDVYKIRVVSTHPNGQEADLSFFYQVTTAGTSLAEQINNTFWSLVSSAWVALQNEEVDVTLRSTTNINTPSDFEANGVSVAGTRTGSELPSGMTTVMRSSKNFPGDRYSYRRFMFGSVSDLDDALDANWSTSYLTACGTLAGLLNNTLAPAGGDVLAPVQLQAGWTLGSAPTVNKTLVGIWSYATRPGWLDSREPEYAYAAALS